MGKQWKQCQTLFFGAPKSLQVGIAAMKLKDAYSLEEKLVPTQIAYIQKQKQYFANKGPSSQGYGFSSGHVWMWDLDYKENWELLNYGVGENSWVPWTEKRSKQSILKEINPEYSLEGLMLKLKLQYFGPWCEELIHLKRPWCWERLKAGGEGDDRGWDGWMASPTQWIWVWVNSGS